MAMIERSRLRLGIEAQTLGGDKAYGYGAAVRRLCEKPWWNRMCRRPVTGQWNAQGIFGKDDFIYDREHDELICPVWQASAQTHRARAQSPNRIRGPPDRLPRMPAQTRNARGRATVWHTATGIRITWNRAEAARHTPGHWLSQHYRKRIEHLFAEAKEQMGLRRARRRGWANVTEQCLLTAMVQNMKRIVAALPLLLPAAAAICPRPPLRKLLGWLWRQMNVLTVHLVAETAPVLTT